jgi:hypothetical protein
MKEQDNPVEAVKNLSNKFMPEDSAFVEEDGKEIVCAVKNTPKVLEIENFYD